MSSELTLAHEHGDLWDLSHLIFRESLPFNE